MRDEILIRLGTIVAKRREVLIRIEVSIPRPVLVQYVVTVNQVRLSVQALGRVMRTYTLHFHETGIGVRVLVSLAGLQVSWHHCCLLYFDALGLGVKVLRGRSDQVLLRLLCDIVVLFE